MRSRACSPAANVSASRSRGHLRTSPGCCSPTSRPAPSTRRRARRCSSWWTRSGGRTGRRSCSSRTTTTWRRMPTACCVYATVSFMPKRRDRCQPDRAPRGIERADEADAEREGEAPREGRHRIGRADQAGELSPADEHLRGDDAERAAEREREQADRDRLGDDHRADPPAGPADRPQDPDLTCALEHGHGHRVRHGDAADDQREHGDDPAGGEDQPARRVDLDRLPRLGDGGDAGEAVLQPFRDGLHALAELDRHADRRDLARPLRECLERAQRQQDPEVLEMVSRGEDAADRERLSAEPDPVAHVLERMVARHHRRAVPGDDDETAVRELVRIEAEVERVVVDEQLHARDRRHARLVRDLRRERLRQERPREVGDAGLEEAEVGAADVRQVARGALHAVRDREQRDDQPDAEADADGRERRPRAAAAEIAPDERCPGHGDALCGSEAEQRGQARRARPLANSGVRPEGPDPWRTAGSGPEGRTPQARRARPARRARAMRSAPVAPSAKTSPPAAISTSPAEKTFPHGTQPGRAQRSTSHARFGEGSTALFRLRTKWRPAARSALGSAGMWPPFVVIASTFSSIPTATSGTPGTRKLAAHATTNNAYEQSQRTTPARSDVRQGSALNGKAAS